MTDETQPAEQPADTPQEPEKKPRKAREINPDSPAADTGKRGTAVKITTEGHEALAHLRVLMSLPGYAGPTEEDIISPAITAAFAAAMGRINGRKAAQ